MTTETAYVAELLDALPNESGYSGEAIGTGGNCEAVAVTFRPDGSQLLITDGDAGLPDGDGAWIGRYDADGSMTDDYAWVAGPVSATQVAQVVGAYLNAGDFTDLAKVYGVTVTTGDAAESAANAAVSATADAREFREEVATVWDDIAAKLAQLQARYESTGVDDFIVSGEEWPFDMSLDEQVAQMSFAADRIRTADES